MQNDIVLFVRPIVSINVKNGKGSDMNFADKSSSSSSASSPVLAVLAISRDIFDTFDD